MSKDRSKTDLVDIQTSSYFKEGVYWRDAECTHRFYDQKSAATLWEQKEAQERTTLPLKLTPPIDVAHIAGVIGLGIVLALVINGPRLWNYLDESGYFYHDDITIVYSPAWQYGEYKSGSTLNGAKPQNILCDGGVPSGRTKDGKIFMVRFWGQTYDEGKPAVGGALNVAPTLFYWNCRKNEGSDPSITCKQDKK